MRIWERVPHHARKGNRCGYTQFQRRELSCRITLSYTGKRGREKEKRPVSSSSTKEDIQPDSWQEELEIRVLDLGNAGDAWPARRGETTGETTPSDGSGDRP